MSIEFKAWPKTSRLFREVTVTEKIDGTNACIVFEPDPVCGKFDCGDDAHYVYAAQSRNRIITSKSDNAGFAAWVQENHAALFEKLGYGRHYGEWWGQKIGRKYNMPFRVFSIFNTDLWSVQLGDNIAYEMQNGFLTHVPVLGRFDMDTSVIMDCAEYLNDGGSVASRVFGIEFDRPEGICVFHSTSRVVQKFTFDKNDAGKWESLT